MKKLVQYAITTVFVVSLAACGSPQEQPTPSATEPVTQAAPAVELVDGVQVVTLTAGPTGYQPREVELQAGVPARFVVTRTDTGTCLERIHFADFDLDPIELPLNEPVTVDMTPEEAGTFTFVCGMGMQSGTVVVAP